MDIRHINYFLVLKKYEHLSTAAEFLKLSPPYLSKCISALEQELGVKLFDRVGRRIRLNAKGESFAYYAEQAMQQLDMGRFQLQSTRYETMGNINIVSYTYTPILTDCIHAYRELNPQVTFSVGDSTARTYGGEPEFILRAMADPGQMKNLLRRQKLWAAQPLFEEESCFLIASEAYCPVDWKQYDGCVDLRDLRDAKFIASVVQDLFWVDLTYELCQQAGFFPQVVCRTNDLIVKARMVEAGEGVAFVPESCLKDILSFGFPLYGFRLKDPLPPRKIFLMYQKESLMTEAAKDFYEFCLDYYSPVHG